MGVSRDSIGFMCGRTVGVCVGGHGSSRCVLVSLGLLQQGLGEMAYG